MTKPFTDTYPNEPRILFVGLPHSTHTHSWIQLLDKSQLNVRLFGLGMKSVRWPAMLAMMPDDWKIPTYISEEIEVKVNAQVYFPSRKWYWWEARIRNRLANRLRPTGTPHHIRLLLEVIREWQPHIIHTLGLDPAGYFFYDVCQKYSFDFTGKWVLQLRGGSDLTPGHWNHGYRNRALTVCRAADSVVTDNHWNIQFLKSNGVTQIAPIAPVPGTGGIDITPVEAKRQVPASQRNLILFPKAATSAWAQALPVLEAFRICADRLPKFEFHLTAADSATELWHWKLLHDLPGKVIVHQKRVARDQIFALMSRSRVMISPSLVDGIPNVLYEAMVYGAVPIISPLETIPSTVKDKENVLFARNLYPQEIADALVQAMTDDALADRITRNNRLLVQQIANRAIIRQKVIDFYYGLVG